MLTFATLLLSTAIQGSACGAAAPAAPALDQIRRINSEAELIGITRLADGNAAPATLKLPSIANTEALAKYMRERYPETLRTDSTKYDLAVFWVCIDTAGAVVSPAMVGTTGAAALDTLAAQLVKMTRFVPATVDGARTAVWMPFPVQLSPMGLTGGAKPTPKELAKAPVFTPYTVRPELTNRDEIAREMVMSYPPKLKSQGVGGAVVVWLFVDEKGAVKNTKIKETTGNRELDDFALGLGSLMRFTPAMNRDVKVPVWVAVPLRLRPN